MSKGWKVINEKEFAKIKEMGEMGLTRSQISKLTNRPSGTIGALLKADSLNEYRERNRKIRNDQRAKQQAKETQEAEPLKIVVPTPETNGVNDRQMIINSLKLLADRIGHLEAQNQEMIDEQHAILAIMEKRKVIW